jgi:Glycosyl hydrolase family 76/Ricin-type beta-trefoil lectin domain-like
MCMVFIFGVSYSWSFHLNCNPTKTFNQMNINMKTQVMRQLRGVWYTLTLTMLVLGGMGTASAFTSSEVTTAWNAYNSAFYFTLNNGAQGYYRVEDGSGTPTSFWQFAEQIEIAEDAKNTTMVNQLCSGFTTHNGTDWSGNSYNDDLEWASIAFVRAYQMTGNSTYLTLAENGFNVAYNRGWDTTYGGGIWQNTADANGPGKLSCANGPATIAAYLIYQSTGISSYLTKAKAINAWQKANCFNPSTGEVYESNTSTNTCYSYDSGTFAGSCWYLGDTTSAMKCGNWVVNNWGVPMQHFGTGADAGGFNGICMRWLAKVGYTNAYFLRDVCNNAWGLRNSRNLTSDGWYAGQTSDTDALYSWDCGSMIAAMLDVAPSPSLITSGHVYQLEPQNATSSRLDVRGAATTNYTPVQIYTSNNTAAQKWQVNVVDSANGIYSLVPQNATSMCLDVQGANSTNGTPVDIYTANGTAAQQWELIAVDEQNGIYVLGPECARGKRLDVTGGNTADGTPVQIYDGNQTVAQQWKLIY